MPQNFVVIQSTNYKILTQHTVWKIQYRIHMYTMHMILKKQCVEGDERQQTDINR
jgi:hypothetical protein